MIKVLFVTDIDSPSGYSTHARNLLKSMELVEDLDIKLQPNKHDSATIRMDSAQRQHYKDLASKSWDDPDVAIHFETPEFYNPQPDRYNIGFTQWETTRIPDTDMHGQPRLNWVTQMNRMDEIWTSSTDAKKAFSRSGVTVPVTVMPGPVDTSLHRSGLEELPITGLTVDAMGNEIPREERPFVIGFMGQWTKRKNIEEWLIWLMTQFSGKKVAGLIKTYGSHIEGSQQQQVFDRVQACRSLVQFGPEEVKGADIFMLTEHLSDDEIAQWFQTVDMYVSFSRGEGFAFPVVQAMASGCIAAHTGWGGPTDYIQDGESGILLPFTMEPVYGMSYNPWYRADQWWARIDMYGATARIIEAMQWDRDKVDAMRQAGQEAVEETCSIPAIAKLVAERMAELYNAGTLSPKSA